MPEHDMDHLAYLDAVALADVGVLREKERTYQGSWKRAGGRSAWFMFRRNMDRLLAMCAAVPFALDGTEAVVGGSGGCQLDAARYATLKRALVAEDVFALIEAAPGGEDGTVLACLRDLRRYATLVEAEMVARGVVAVERARDADSNAPPVAPPSLSGAAPEPRHVVWGEPVDPLATPTGRLYDAVAQVALGLVPGPETADTLRALMKRYPGADPLTVLAETSSSDRDFVVDKYLDGVLRDPRPGRDAPGSAEARILRRAWFERLSRAVSHACNAEGIDARSDTPDHVLGNLLAVRALQYLDGVTDGQLLDAGYGPGPDGEIVAPPGEPPSVVEPEPVPPRWTEPSPPSTARGDDPVSTDAGALADVVVRLLGSGFGRVRVRLRPRKDTGEERWETVSITRVTSGPTCRVLDVGFRNGRNLVRTERLHEVVAEWDRRSVAAEDYRGEPVLAASTPREPAPSEPGAAEPPAAPTITALGASRDVADLLARVQARFAAGETRIYVTVTSRWNSQTRLAEFTRLPEDGEGAGRGRAAVVLRSGPWVQTVFFDAPESLDVDVWDTTSLRGYRSDEPSPLGRQIDA